MTYTGSSGAGESNTLNHPSFLYQIGGEIPLLSWLLRWFCMALMELLWFIIEWVLLLLLCAFIFVEVVLRVVRRHIHFPAPAFMVFFINNPLRRRMQPPAKVVEWAGIREDMQVLELGPGGGTFTFEAARTVGPKGHIYAVDIEPMITRRLERKVTERGIKNITVKTASAYELPLPDNSLDAAFMVAVLAEVPDRQRALKEFRRVLKPDGILGIGELLFDPDYPRKRTVIGWCTEAGFELNSSHDVVLHYMLTFRPRPA